MALHDELGALEPPRGQIGLANPEIRSTDVAPGHGSVLVSGDLQEQTPLLGALGERFRARPDREFLASTLDRWDALAPGAFARRSARSGF